MWMTTKHIKDRIKAIKEKSKIDFESAYSDEIELYKDVLKSLAKGGNFEISGIAKEALKAGRIKMTRATA